MRARSFSLKFAADNFPALGDYALYYLALAQHDQGDLKASADTLDRLVSLYPDSVLIDPRRDDAGGQPAEARAQRRGFRRRLATDRARPASFDRAGRRVAEARALIALGNPKAAYAQLMELRDKYPHSDADADARTLVREILASNPEVADTNSLAYHRDEAELLLREGALSEADEQANAGLAMAPEPAVRAELVWVTARALKPEPDRAKSAILEYLQIAPRGPDAAAALEALALIYWHDDQDDLARATFNRLVASFPAASWRPVRCCASAEFSKNCISSIRRARNIGGWLRAIPAATPPKTRAFEFPGRYTWRATTDRGGWLPERECAREGPYRSRYVRVLARARAGKSRRRQCRLARFSTGSPIAPTATTTPNSRAAASPPHHRIFPQLQHLILNASATPAVSGVAEYHMARLQTLRAIGTQGARARRAEGARGTCGRHNRDAAFRAGRIRERRRVV